MKILFVDNSTDLQIAWIDPLRKKGWGVVRARSVEDATRMMVLHGEGVEVIAVHEKFVSWAEKQNLPFSVLVTHWTEKEILTHQNSNHSAVAYLPYAKGCDAIFTIFEEKQDHQSLRRTGTESLSLQDYSQIMSRPEVTRTISGLHLAASEIVLGGEAASEAAEVQEIKFEKRVEGDSELKLEPSRKIFSSTKRAAPAEDVDNRTVILDTTQMNFETSEDESFGDINSLSGLIEQIPEPYQPLEIPPPVRASPSPPPPPLSYGSALPVHNQFAIDPSPSASVSDVATLKSYLSLREQDVAVLSGQVRSSQERIQQLEMALKVEKARSAELAHLASKQESQIKNYDQEKQVDFEVLEKHIEDINFQLKERTDKVRTIEGKLRFTVDEINKVKERVRVDIRRIRVREKELEGQLEILKKDSSALLQARDEKNVELKRKLDLLEFNMELVQEQFSKERKSADELKNRLKDAASVMKQAGGLLEQ